MRDGGDNPLVTYHPGHSTTTAAILQLGAGFFAGGLEGLPEGIETPDSHRVQLMALRDRLNGE